LANLAKQQRQRPFSFFRGLPPDVGHGLNKICSGKAGIPLPSPAELEKATGFGIEDDQY
jgi:hypothetical protein